MLYILNVIQQFIIQHFDILDIYQKNIFDIKDFNLCFLQLTFDIIRKKFH